MTSPHTETHSGSHIHAPGEGIVVAVAPSGVRRFGLVLVPLLVCGAGMALRTTMAEAAVPTCNGKPATIVGTAKDDTLIGTNGPDVIVGLGGLDVIEGRGGADVICGGATRHKEIDGDDVYQQLSGGEGDDQVFGGPGVDEVYGEGGADLLVGGGGDDFVSGGRGADTVRGGPGADLLGGDEDTDRVYGEAGADYLSDFQGANLLDGGAGDDNLSSGPGDEVIRGGPGRDVASYVELLSAGSFSSHCNAITADLSRGTAHGTGFGTDTLQTVENVFTGGGNDALIGDGNANVFYTGGYPCDERSPHDSVDGRGGADRITFDTENTEFGSAPGPVRVDLAAHTARWDNQGSPHPIVVTLRSIENVTGTEYPDVIAGDALANGLVGGSDFAGRGDVIRGRGGADRISGRAGNDTLYGGPGADVLSGGRGHDVLKGGPGRDLNDGGRSTDTCRSPARGPRAVRCER